MRDKGVEADCGVFECSGRWTEHVRVSSEPMGLRAGQVLICGITG